MKQVGAVNIDLKRERQRAEVASEEFAEWWAGGRAALTQRRSLEKLFFDDPEFDDPTHISYMSHKELYEHSIARAVTFLKKLRAWQVQQEEKEGTTAKTPIQSLYDFRTLLSGPLGTALLQQGNPLRMHFSMFLPTLLGQGTEEQQRTWLERSWKMQGIIGTYAQTELGHGTFIRGLETRADYDVEREEFVLNTPTLTAYKWWPGSLGQTTNMAVVMAQLYIKGKHCGLQSFLVRLRNEDTHMPELGVDVGDIGPKVGFGGVNNGFLGLKNVRIPRMQMLMKNSQVLPDGTFVKGGMPLLTYGTMVFVRVLIVRDSSFCLLQAATIATRYSAVRRQSPIDPEQPEPQIMDHVTQQDKVFPQIAKGLFYRIAADYIWKMYQGVMKELDVGNQRNLPELHALTCCLKAVCTQGANDGVEVLRKACGGQGFLSSANFSNIYAAITGACTYEGENTVLHLQTARFLVKSFVDGIKRKYLPPTVVYLRGQGRPVWSNDLKALVTILEFTARGKTRVAFDYQSLKRRQMSKKVDQIAANESAIKLMQASAMHGSAFLARITYEEVAKLRGQVSPPISKVLTQLLEIFILEMFLSSLGHILRFYPIAAPKIEELELRYQRALAAFRPNAVAVVDGFDFHDRVLGSTLGCHDGRVYERLMAEAKKSPLNQELVNGTFHTHLKPFMRGKL